MVSSGNCFMGRGWKLYPKCLSLDMCYFSFSSLAMSRLMFWNNESMLCVKFENENQNPHPFMKKHSHVYYSVNDCPWSEIDKIIFEFTFVELQLYHEGKKSLFMNNS